MNASTIFEDIPVTIGDVLKKTLSLFGGNWKVLVSLSLAQFGTFIVAAIMLFGITFLAAAAYLQTVLSMVQNLQNQGGFARHLLDYSTGTGVNRVLEQYYGIDVDDDEFEMPDLFSVEFIMTMIFMYLIWVVTLALISSVFQGAFTHTLAEIYAGGTPTVSKSIRHGMSKMCNLFLYSLLFMLAVTGLGLLILLPTFLLALGDDQPNIGGIFLGILIFIVAVVIFSSALAAAVPSIVVESKTATQAFGRSWALCKNFICFIFCSQFSYHVVAMIVSVFINNILDHLPDVISVLGHLCVSLVTSSIAPVVAFVLYMSVRTRTENITQEDLALEIDSNVPLAHAVEMSDAAKDSKGLYANVNPNPNSEMI